jgi:hypothetical protein
MSKEAILQSRSYPANGDLSSTGQYLFVTLGSSGIAVNTSAGGRCIGVLQNNPTSGVAGQVAIFGTSKVHCGGTFAIGAAIASNASGQAVVAATGNKVLGYAEEVGASGQIAAITLLQSGTL